jgi:hypothetical protein
MMKVQAQQQAEQMRMEADKQKGQMEGMLEQARMEQEKLKGQAELQAKMAMEQMIAEREQQKLQAEAALKAHELQIKDELERWKTQLDAETKIVIAQMQAQTALKQTTLSTNAARKDGMKADEEGNEMPGDLATLAERVNENIQELMKLKEEMAQPRGPRKVTLSSGRTVTVH